MILIKPWRDVPAGSALLRLLQFALFPEWLESGQSAARFRRRRQERLDALLILFLHKIDR
jgi:hypothetical protein